MAPPIIFGLKPTSLTARTMPTESIGADDNEIRIRLRNRPHHRREVGGCRWISAVIDDGEAGCLDILARAFAGIQAELRVGRHDRDSLRLRILPQRQVDEAFG